MSGAHTGPDALYVPGAGPVHRAAPEAKVLGTLAFVTAAVATPREVLWAFAAHAGVAATAVVVAGLPLAVVARRLRVAVPFVAFALFLPIVGAAPRVDVLGASLSQPGLWAAWNVLAKATLGVVAAVTLAGTTPVSDLLRGLQRLRAPRVIVEIAGFMVRYLEVIGGEARRMHVARQSRGYDPRWLWQAQGVAASIGTLFVRSYERGERVQLAMASRGYAGGPLPDLAALRRPDRDPAGDPAGDAVGDPAGDPAGGRRMRTRLLVALPLTAWATTLAALAAG